MDTAQSLEEKKPRRKWRSKFSFIKHAIEAIVGGVLGLGLVAATGEAYYRTLAWAEKPWYLLDYQVSTSFSPYIKSHIPGLSARMAPNPLVAGKRGSPYFNNWGFRDLKDFEVWNKPKDHHPPTIVIIGDSISSGFGIEKTEDVYPSQLQSLLDSQGSHLEVLNFSVSAYKVPQFYATLNYNVLPYVNSDLIIITLSSANDLVYTAWNNSIPAAANYPPLNCAGREYPITPDFAPGFRERLEFLLVNKSAFSHALTDSLMDSKYATILPALKTYFDAPGLRQVRHFLEDQGTYFRPNRVACRDERTSAYALEKMIELSHDHGAQVVIFPIPYYGWMRNGEPGVDEEGQKILDWISHRNPDVPIHSPEPSILSYLRAGHTLDEICIGQEDGWHHPNAAGSTLLAEDLNKFLKETYPQLVRN